MVVTAKSEQVKRKKKDTQFCEFNNFLPKIQYFSFLFSIACLLKMKHPPKHPVSGDDPYKSVAPPREGYNSYS